MRKSFGSHELRRSSSSLEAAFGTKAAVNFVRTNPSLMHLASNTQSPCFILGFFSSCLPFSVLLSSKLTCFRRQASLTTIAPWRQEHHSHASGEHPRKKKEGGDKRQCCCWYCWCCSSMERLEVVRILKMVALGTSTSPSLSPIFFFYPSRPPLSCSSLSHVLKSFSLSCLLGTDCVYNLSGTPSNLTFIFLASITSPFLPLLFFSQYFPPTSSLWDQFRETKINVCMSCLACCSRTTHDASFGAARAHVYTVGVCVLKCRTCSSCWSKMSESRRWWVAISSRLCTRFGWGGFSVRTHYTQLGRFQDASWRVLVAMPTF